MAGNAVEATISRARRKLIELHYERKTGHLGGSLSCLDVLHALFDNVIGSEDFFVLSKGHAASALYVTLWSYGHLDEKALDTYYVDGTTLCGHVSCREAWVPFGTGSLGHGLSLAAGLSLGKKLKKEQGTVFCLCSEGEFQEGSTWEALIFSIHHKLNNLRILVDVNGWQGFGSTLETASQDLMVLKKRISSFGFPTSICDGHDCESIGNYLKNQEDRALPTVLLMETCKGKGAPPLEGTFISHYAKLTKHEYDETMRQYEDDSHERGIC